MGALTAKVAMETMKVADLKKELQSRNLSCAGRKSDLLKRLLAALSEDDGSQELGESLSPSPLKAPIPVASRPRLRLPARDLPDAMSKRARIKSHAAEYSDEMNEYAAKSIYGDVKRAFLSTLIFAQAEGGSAVMVSSSGDILTAAHCLGETPKVGDQRCLLFPDGTVCVAKAVAFNFRLDVALMKCQLLHDGSANNKVTKSKKAKAKGRHFPWQQASHRFTFVDIMCSHDPDSSILATAEEIPQKRGSKRLRQAKQDIPVMCIGQSILKRHLNISFSSGQYLGVYKGPNNFGKLLHSAWTYFGTSGGPLFFRGKLVGLHTSYDPAACTRHGVHWRDVRKFLRRHKKRHSINLKVPVTHKR